MYPLLYRFLGITGLLFLVSVLYYAYQLVLNHGLPMAEYGEITSLLAWTVLISFPSVILKIFLTRYVTLHESEPQKQLAFIYNTFWHTILVSLYTLGGALFIGIFLVSRFQISYLLFLFMGITVFLTIILTFFRSIAYIDGRFSLYAKNTTFEILFRIIISYIALIYTKDITSLYIIYFLSILLSLIFFSKDIRELMIKSSDWIFDGDEISEMKKQLLPMAFISVFLMTLGTLEVVIARQILSKDELGQFSTLIIIGKLILAGLSIWVSVGMPYFSQPKNHKKHLVILYSLHFMTVVSTILFFYFFGNWMIGALFSPIYQGITPYVMPVVISMLIVGSISMIIQHFSIAGNRYAGYLSLLLPVTLTLFLLTSEPNLSSVVNNLLYGYSVGSALWIFLFFIISMALDQKKY